MIVQGSANASSRTESQQLLRASRPTDQHGLYRWLPGLYTLRNYHREWLLSDLSAGLVLTAVLVPVGMAYSEAAGLPAIYGLYATIVPLIAYAILGPSRVLVLGPDSSLAPMIAAAILPLAAGDPERAVSVAHRIIRSGRRALAPRIHYGPARETDPLRIHEWHRPHRSRQPGSQDVWFLRRGRSIARAHHRPCFRSFFRANELGCAGSRRKHSGGHPAS
jgi:hypothetical protein